MKFFHLSKLLLFTLLLTFMSEAYAHQVRPAIINVDLTNKNFFLISASLNFEALISGIRSNTKKVPNHSDEIKAYQTYRKLSAKQLKKEIHEILPEWLGGTKFIFDGKQIKTTVNKIIVKEEKNLNLSRLTEIHLTGKKPPKPSFFRWEYNPNFGDSIVRIKLDNISPMRAVWVKSGNKSDKILLSERPTASGIDTFIDYVYLGFVHIIPRGLDHILFVLALFFLSLRTRILVTQITFFTIAHTVTLAASTIWPQFQISSVIVESLIAASIIFVAVENLFTAKLTKLRPWIIIFFGLMHGLGFAGVLRDFEDKQEDLLISLAGFSVGVELGQIIVVIIAYVLLGVQFGRKHWFRRRIAVPASLGIGIFGGFWLLERLFFTEY